MGSILMFKRLNERQILFKLSFQHKKWKKKILYGRR